MSGVIFVVCIPSSNYEYLLKNGKPRELITIDSAPKCKLEVELRNKKAKSIPIHLTQRYYSEMYDHKLKKISENDGLITMENILQELLKKLEVEHVVWISDRMGNYFEVMFPLSTGDKCETMLHCLTQLGIGVSCKSIVSVLPCNVVHSSFEHKINDEETLIKKDEDTRRWRQFVESIRSKLTVKQVVDGVRGGGELSFDYLTLIITAEHFCNQLRSGKAPAALQGLGVSMGGGPLALGEPPAHLPPSLAALGLVDNNASNIVAAMLVSPLMGPVMAITFGTIIADRSLVKSGFESLIMGMLVSLLFGFIFGLILGTTEMPWGYGDWPTEEMKARGNVRSLWMGVLWALTSGTGVALALLQGSAGPLIGIAISASLLPPVVNCGLYWALACILLLYPDVKIPHLKGELNKGNSTYKPLYNSYMPIEFAVNGIVSCCLTIVNVICIFITAIIFLKIKEVAAPYTSSPDLRRFWEQDIKTAREANRNNTGADDEQAELVLEDVNQDYDDIREKLEAAVKEALDDDTYRKVKRMSYQSHNAAEVIGTIGLHARTPVSKRSSVISNAFHKNTNNDSNMSDIATLDKLLTSLLDLQNNSPHRSHFGTPRASQMPILEENTLRNQPESWPDKIYEDSIVRNVLLNLKASSSEEPFLTPK